MRIYTNVEEMYKETRRDLKEMGISYMSDSVQDKKGRFETLELNAYGYTLVKFDDARSCAIAHGINPEWLANESEERTNLAIVNKNPGSAWPANKRFWEQFLRDGRFAYTYAERLHPQLPHIIHELAEHSNTRQAVLTMYDQHQDIMNFGGRDRIPCSMYYQFLIRDNKLNMSYTMRSCDLEKFFLADVCMALDLQTWMARILGYEVGNFTHFIGSLHTIGSNLEGEF